MNTRKAMIYLHLALASLFMPMLLLMPFTGAMYLWGFQGEQTKKAAFEISEAVPLDSNEQEMFFRNYFKKEGIDFNFEYIKRSKNEFIFRPQSREHFIANQEDDNRLIVYKVEPNLLKRLIELHKGHGPRIMRVFESIFGVSLILTTLSGLWLAWSVKAYRKITFISFGIGAGIIALCLV